MDMELVIILEALLLDVHYEGSMTTPQHPRGLTVERHSSAQSYSSSV